MGRFRAICEHRKRLSARSKGLLLSGAVAIAIALPPAPEAAVRFKRSGAETLGGADALAGVREACELDARHLWVEVEGRGDCIAIYPAGSIEGARSAVLFFEGDIPPSFRRDPLRLKGHLKALLAALDRLSKVHDVPFVLVARPGTFGSTGNHADRRKVREFLVMRATVDAFRERFAMTEVVLAGQSGGATIVGGLLALGLANVRCAVPASGGFDLAAMLDWHSSRQGIPSGHREHPAMMAGDFNVMDRIGYLRADPGRRIFVIGDKADKVTPFAQQKRFAEAVREGGHHAEVIEARAGGADHHGLAFAALKAAGLCASGATDDQIRRAVAP
jgi:hypothetical protein